MEVTKVRSEALALRRKPSAPATPRTHGNRTEVPAGGTFDQIPVLDPLPPAHELVFVAYEEIPIEGIERTGLFSRLLLHIETTMTAVV